MERRTIARELHDQIGQSLTVLKLMIGQAGRSTPDKAGGVLSEAQGVVSELIQQVREMSLNLRPSMLDDLGLLPTLLWHFEKFSKQSGIRINFAHDGLERGLTPEINTAAYRIVQEALTNVARYAGVKEVNVLIRGDEKSLYIEIEDRGTGFDPAKLEANTSTGISGMRERVHLLGGKLIIETRPGEGTCLMVNIPVSVTDH
jgi:signal transduction histidine kinase